MADWPITSMGSRLIVNTAVGFLRGAFPGGVGSSVAWPAANRAIYCPVWITETVTVTHLMIYVGTSSGNLDIGIYTEDGTRLVSTGSTAVQPGGAAHQSFNITDTTLAPGTYFFALCVDNTTATIMGEQTNYEWLRVSGRQQEALGSVTLPATASFSNPVSSVAPFIFAVTRMGVA